MKFTITLSLTLPSDTDSDAIAAEAFAEELLLESREHLLDRERIDLVSVVRDHIDAPDDQAHHNH
jgi:hypothetical protein